MTISQNAILAKCQSPKSLLLIHFSINLSETFKINVNMNFANNLEAECSFRPQKQFWAQNSEVRVFLTERRINEICFIQKMYYLF